MRLTPAQVATIKSTTHAVLGEGAQVTLFGSRVHDALSRKKNACTCKKPITGYLRCQPALA